MTMAPSWFAGTWLRLPWNLPMGVRAADRITTSSSRLAHIRCSFCIGTVVWITPALRRGSLLQGEALAAQYFAQAGAMGFRDAPGGVFEPAVVFHDTGLPGNRDLPAAIDTGSSHDAVVFV